jgi:hypothetical protein
MDDAGSRADRQEQEVERVAADQPICTENGREKQANPCERRPPAGALQKTTEKENIPVPMKRVVLKPRKTR